jgi:hypothetical protein
MGGNGPQADFRGKLVAIAIGGPVRFRENRTDGIFAQTTLEAFLSES